MMKFLWHLLFIFCLVSTSSYSFSAQRMAEIIKQKNWDKCETNENCGSIGERDQCSVVPLASRYSAEAYEELKKDWKPRCFGPARKCLPKCSQNKCVCVDGGKAPD